MPQRNLQADGYRPDLPLGPAANQTDEIVLLANAAGLEVSVHVDGSKTAREAVDGYIKSIAAGNTGARNSLQHFAYAHPDDVVRIITHNIPGNITSIWGTT